MLEEKMTERERMIKRVRKREREKKRRHSERRERESSAVAPAQLRSTLFLSSIVRWE